MRFLQLVITKHCSLEKKLTRDTDTLPLGPAVAADPAALLELWMGVTATE